MTLVEVLITMLLLAILFIAGFSAVFFNTQTSYRVADHTSALVLVQAKMEAVRAATYNFPSATFGTSTVTFTNVHSIALSKAGTNFLVKGTLVTKIEPTLGGHLITVTGTFPAPRRPTVVELQTVVNKFSGGQQ